MNESVQTPVDVQNTDDVQETGEAQVPSDLVRDRELMGDASEATAGGSSKPSDEDVLEALKDVVDPELGINVVDLGLIYGVHVEDDSSVVVDMTLTSAACPLTDMIEDQAESALEGMVNQLHINWVWMPPWTAAKISDDGRDQLRAMGFNV